jgi:hypothetical protein
MGAVPQGANMRKHSGVHDDHHATNKAAMLTPMTKAKIKPRAASAREAVDSVL